MICFSLSPNTSHATIGLVTVNPILVSAGLIMSGTSGIAFTLSQVKTHQGGVDNFLWGAVIAMGSLASLGIGLLVLDGEQGMVFAELDQANAEKLGVSESERLSFNSELDQVNALAEYVDSELAAIRNPTPEDAKSLWNTVTDTIHPLTLSTMQKVSLQLFP